MISEAPVRTPYERILEQHRVIAEHVGSRILDSCPDIVMILNQERRIVHANAMLLERTGFAAVADVIGMRPGDILHCVNADEPESCGVSGVCSECGAVQAILGSLGGLPAKREGRILTRLRGRVDALNMQVHTSLLEVAGQPFVIAYFRDIGDQTRKEYLEHLFFHDMLNALNGIMGAVGLIRDAAQGDIRDLAEMALQRGRLLAREVSDHRLLLAAEKMELTPEAEDIRLKDVCDAVATLAAGSPASEVEVESRCLDGDAMLRTDGRILYRVLENLLRNGQEASKIGQKVVLTCGIESGQALFSVWSPVDMDPEVRKQVFHRGFSTKGKGRGLGTYGVKLLTENYLRGSVGLTSAPGEGTTFSVRVPLS